MQTLGLGGSPTSPGGESTTFSPAKTPSTSSLANASLDLDRYFHCKLEALGHEGHHTNRPKSKDLCGKDDQIGADLCNSHRSDAVIS